jgi:hypothetical protein
MRVFEMGANTSHYLLPHERWAANWLRRRQEAHPEVKSYSDLIRNSGVEGLRLQAALFANFISGALILWAALIARLTSSGASLPSLCLLCIGLALMALALVRGVQGVNQSRKLRRERR